MPEKELSRNLTRMVKGADKLIRDVEKDVNEILAAASSVKQTFIAIKNRIQKPEDTEGGEP